MPKTMTKMDEFAVRMANSVINKRWLVLLATLLVTFGVATGMQHLTFSNNYRDFFSESNPELRAFEEFQSTYTKNDNFFFTIVPKSGDVFNKDTLTFVEELTERSWQIPFSLRVDSVTNFQHTWAEDDDLIVENLVEDAVSYSDADLAKRKTIALAEPLIVNQLVTSDARAIAVNVVVQYPQLSPMEVPETVGFVRQMRDELIAKYPDHEISLTGVSMLNSAFQEAGFGDVQTIIPIMYLLLLVLMAVTVRSISGTLVTVAMILFASLVGMGAAGYGGVGLTPISLSAPTIILTLAIADAVHILLTMRKEMSRGMAKRDAIVEAIRVNFLPVMVTSLTTANGFLALNFSDAPPFWHLGNISAVGVVAAWLMSVTFLPAFMSMLPVRVSVKAESDKPSAMIKLAEFVIRHNKKLFYGVGIAAALVISAIPQMQFNDQWTAYFDERIEFRRDADYSNDYFGFYPIEFSVLSDSEGGVSSPEYLAKLDEFAEWARSQPNVTHVYSISDIMKRLNRNMHGDDLVWHKLPEDRELAAQYLLLYEISLPYGLDLNDRINLDKSASRMTVTLDNVSSNDMRDIA